MGFQGNKEPAGWASREQISRIEWASEELSIRKDELLGSKEQVGWATGEPRRE